MPSLDFPEHKSEHVLVQASGTVSTLLDCDIQPGAAPESYSVAWFQLNSDHSFSRIGEGINMETFSLTLQVDLSHNNTVYQCRVDIDHDGVGTGDSPIPYDGAEITLYTAGKAACAPYHCSVYWLLFPCHTVRASIAEGVQNMTATVGEQANLSCSAEGSEVDIEWTVDGEEYEICSPGRDTAICFENSYMSDTATTRSTLIIANSSSLGLGSHTVQCVVQQDLAPGFGTEPFQESRTASLYISGSSFLKFPSSLLHFP